MEITIVAVTAIASILASSGLWTFLLHRYNKDNSEAKLIRGIAYTTLMNQSTSYIRRGKITRSEFVELHRMLYEPYKNLGGNGAAERAFEIVKQLPDSDESVIEQIEREMDKDEC